MTKILPNVFNEIISLYFSYYIHVVLEKRPESIFGQIFFPHFNSGSPVTKKSGNTVCFRVSKISSTDVLFEKNDFGQFRTRYHQSLKSYGQI